MTDDIVARLRERARVAREENTETARSDARHFEQAAAEIEKLRADNERKDRALERMGANARTALEGQVYHAEQAATLRAENERLRAALVLTEDALNGLRDDMLDDRENIATALLIEQFAAGIRAALTNKEDSHD